MEICRQQMTAYIILPEYLLGLVYNFNFHKFVHHTFIAG